MLGQCNPVLDIAKTHSGKLPIKLTYRLKQYNLFVIWMFLSYVVVGMLSLCLLGLGYFSVRKILSTNSISLIDIKLTY